MQDSKGGRGAPTPQHGPPNTNEPLWSREIGRYEKSYFNLSPSVAHATLGDKLKYLIRAGSGADPLLPEKRLLPALLPAKTDLRPPRRGTLCDVQMAPTEFPELETPNSHRHAMILAGPRGPQGDFRMGVVHALLRLILL